MKNKALRHYKRKKFFYRFFIRKSPRTGAMFGLAWLCMVSALMPASLFLLLIFGDIISDINSFHINLLFIVLGILIVALPLHIYGLILCFSGFSRIFRSVCKSKMIYCIDGVVATLFPPLLSFLLTILMLDRKRIAGALFALSGLIFYILSLLQYINIITALLAGTGCTLTALAFWKDKYKLSFSFLIPLVIAAIAHFSLYGYNIKLQKDVQNCRNKLSQIIGRSVEIKDFFRREKAGFPIDREPLKALIANSPQNSSDEFEFKDAPTAQKKLLEYNKKYPVFVKAIHDFLQLPVSHVAHKVPEDGILYGVLLPELNAFREIARYLAMQIAANPNDKQLVKKCNNDLIKLRNWLPEGEYLLNHLVAIAIERIRLNALENVLRQENFSKQEFAILIGDPIDWEKSLRYSYGGEAAAFKSGFDNLQSLTLTATCCDKKNLKGIKKYMPLFIDVNFHRDYRFALQSFIKASSVPPALSGLEKAELAKVDENEAKCNFYILSGMLLPALGNVYIKSAQITDARRMALLAAEVMEYRKQHGKLPEDLSFLPKVPLSKLDHQPLMYEKTREGFRIFSHTDKGEKPDAEDLQYSYRVRLRMVTGTIPQGVSYEK